MYPWKETFSSWAKSTQLRIDALGLITILGADEVNVSVGRLIPSRYVEFLPLLGAFVLASNQFTKKQPNFVLYNLTDGIMTTEIAGWLSRWLKAQDLHQVHHKIRWEVQTSPLSWPSYIWTALAVSILCNGMLLALTVLSADWWGFANVLAMIGSVVVRIMLVWQNRAGIDKAISEAVGEPTEKTFNNTTKHKSETNDDREKQGVIQQPDDQKTRAKVIVIMDDSKVITMDIPRHLVKPVFTKAPKVPYIHFYRLTRWMGWAAFAIHIISIGMASLPTQICTVVLIVVSTILTTLKFGCDDGRMRTHIAHKMKGENRQKGKEVSCLISSRLKATCSEYPEQNDDLIREIEAGVTLGTGSNPNQHRPPSSGSQSRQKGGSEIDVEAQEHNADVVVASKCQRTSRTERRRDLFIWLNLTDNELALLKAWNLVPQVKNVEWWRKFDTMRKQWNNQHK